MSSEKGFIESTLPGLAMLGLVVVGIVSGQEPHAKPEEVMPAARVESQLRDAAGGLAVQVLNHAHAMLSADGASFESGQVCDDTDFAAQERIRRSF